MKGDGKNSTGKNNFYLSILNKLEYTTNLNQIKKDLNISKQNLNYYLRQLKKKGLVINKGNGIWQPVKNSKNSTKYDSVLKKDTIRGHAYVVDIIPNKFPKNWKDRLKIIESKKINHKLVGALKETPRIKVLGRKIWLCNNSIKIFDKKGESYYGENAIESRKQAFWIFYKIIIVLENKLGFSLKPFNFKWKKEHYALIKNDLAIHHNEKGEILRISDEKGEWLIIDDSLGEGGELENIGKKALPTNIPMTKWWNDNKDHNFKVTPSFILESMDKMTKNLNQVVAIQQMHSDNILKHQKVLDEMLITLKKIQEKL